MEIYNYAGRLLYESLKKVNQVRLKHEFDVTSGVLNVGIANNKFSYIMNFNAFTPSIN